jgi:hypothetical protein
MIVCLCHAFNEGCAKQGFEKLAPDERKLPWGLVAQKITGKPLQCGSCRSGWTDLIAGAENGAPPGP